MGVGEKREAGGFFLFPFECSRGEVVLLVQLFFCFFLFLFWVVLFLHFFLRKRNRSANSFAKGCFSPLSSSPVSSFFSLFICIETCCFFFFLFFVFDCIFFSVLFFSVLVFFLFVFSRVERRGEGEEGAGVPSLLPFVLLMRLTLSPSLRPLTFFRGTHNEGRQRRKRKGSQLVISFFLLRKRKY